MKDFFNYSKEEVDVDLSGLMYMVKQLTTSPIELKILEYFNISDTETTLDLFIEYLVKALGATIDTLGTKMDMTYLNKVYRTVYDYIESSILMVTGPFVKNVRYDKLLVYDDTKVVCRFKVVY